MGGMRKKRPGKGPEKLVNKEKTAKERTQELVRNAIRKKARKPAEAVRFVVLNGSAWTRNTWKSTKARTTCSSGSSAC